MHRIRVIALICMISAPIYSSQIIEYNPAELTRLIESGKTLSQALTDFTQTVNETSPNILKIIGASQNAATELVAQADSSLIRHFGTIERIIDKICVRGGAISLSALGVLFAAPACHSYTKYKKDNDAPQHFWWLGGFSALFFSAAIYLYWNKWDTHLDSLNKLPILTPAIPNLA